MCNNVNGVTEGINNGERCLRPLFCSVKAEARWGTAWLHKMNFLHEACSRAVLITRSSTLQSSAQLTGQRRPKIIYDAVIFLIFSMKLVKQILGFVFCKTNLFEKQSDQLFYQ